LDKGRAMVIHSISRIKEKLERLAQKRGLRGKFSAPRKGKDRKQQVDVYFNFIGNCQVPQKVNIEKMV